MFENTDQVTSRCLLQQVRRNIISECGSSVVPSGQAGRAEVAECIAYYFSRALGIQGSEHKEPYDPQASLLHQWLMVTDLAKPDLTRS
ncbi:hypothetical protein E2C01_038796 [Portunus trituberculatus]|uniref:Uncharacterized protein n=1 Tax=Portunus trituberculatus TaxID=210409 RepID=A0A5B7FD43_PORTR|nr:hypothetical protein [Portunus trituberculatus]